MENMFYNHFGKNVLNKAIMAVFLCNLQDRA